METVEEFEWTWTNVFFVFAMLFMVLHIGMTWITKKQKESPNAKRLKELETEHDSLREKLHNLKLHHRWAIENSDKNKNKEAALEKEIFEMEDRIEEVEKEYRDLKEGRSHVQQTPKKD